MTTLSIEELRKRLESGPAAVFDVRGDVEFDYGHIPGAGASPLGSLVFRVARIINPDSFVAVYSAGRDCRLVTGLPTAGEPGTPKRRPFTKTAWKGGGRGPFPWLSPSCKVARPGTGQGVPLRHRGQGKRLRWRVKGKPVDGEAAGG